ncbi:MAG: DNA-binding response regulator [Chitinophagaceae bacterium]|jgi:two-component system response regulator NreC|nr:DNA-binding response regulator [Chitinophagaceae bacterium]
MQIIYAIKSYVFAEGVNSLFRQEVHAIQPPVFCAVEADEILRTLSIQTCHFLIVDLDYLEGSSGFLFKQIRQVFPSIKVIVIAENLDRRILHAYRNGISASFSKNESQVNVTIAIRTILTNQVYVPNSIIFGVISDGHIFTEIETHLKLLSDKEISVLDQICLGKRMKEISQHLDIAPSTLSTHKLRIMRKLSLDNRRELVSFMSAYMDWKKNKSTVSN